MNFRRIFLCLAVLPALARADRVTFVYVDSQEADPPYTAAHCEHAGVQYAECRVPGAAAFSVAYYGYLSLWADKRFGEFSGSVNGWVEASFSDTLTVFSAGAGTVQFIWGNFVGGGASTQTAGDPGACPGISSSEFCTITSFSPGVPFELWADLGGQIYFDDRPWHYQDPSSDFFLDEIRVVDLSGNPMSGSLRSSSGTIYPLGYGLVFATPEPSFLFFVAGAIGIGAAAYRRRGSRALTVSVGRQTHASV